MKFPAFHSGLTLLQASSLREHISPSRQNRWSRRCAILAAQLLALGASLVVTAHAQAQTPASSASAPAAAVPTDAAPPAAAPVPGDAAAPAPPTPSLDAAPAPTPIEPAPPAPVVTPPPPPPPTAAAAVVTPKEQEEESGETWYPTFTGTLRRGGQYNEIGLFIGNTGSLGVAGRSNDSPQVGIRFLEHHGLLTKFSLGLLAALATSGDRVETGRTTQRQGDYVVTTVYSRSKTDGERQADREMVEGAINGEYVTELILYTDGVFGAGSGKAERVRGGDFYLGGNFSGPFVGDLPSIFDVGVVYSNNHASDVLFDDGHRATVEYLNLGVMVRYQVPITTFLEVLAQVDLNVYGLATKKQDNRVTGTPLRLGAYINATDRFYLRPMISYTTGTHGFGKVVEAGFRF